MLSFSIVTPSLNQGRFIERTIRSVLDQEYAPHEYIVCDGGSTDETLVVASRYVERLTLIGELDAGQASAVNKGIRLTSGAVIGWLNSDDVYLPGAVATVADCFARQPDIDVVYGDAHLLDVEDNVIGEYYTEPWNPERLIQRCYLCQPAVFFRRRIVERFGLLDERLQYCMDYEYWLRLSAGGASFMYIPSVLSASRQHANTKTLRARAAVHDEINSMLRARLGYVPDSWLLNYAHTLVELSRDKGRRYPVPYAAEVVMRSIRLSYQWNSRLSLGLLSHALESIISSTSSGS